MGHGGGSGGQGTTRLNLLDLFPRFLYNITSHDPSDHAKLGAAVKQESRPIRPGIGSGRWEVAVCAVCSRTPRVCAKDELCSRRNPTPQVVHAF